MPNPFYDPGTERPRKVNALFTRIARRYDLINDVQSAGLHRVWKRRAVQAAQVGHGAQALDVCCGTGDLTFALARAGARTVGVDFTPAMLEIASSRAKKMPQLDVSFVQGDAQALAFPADTFDAVIVGYGLRNLIDWRLGLKEMHRVAAPGGRLVVLDFGKPSNCLWRGIYFSYLRLVVPMFGFLLCGSASAYAYILESLNHFPAQEGVASAMEDLNCSDVTVSNILGGVMSINCGRKRAG